MSALDHALRLAHRNLPVFPCGDDKRPLVEHGFKDATFDPELVRAWWRRWPDALIGVPTGDRLCVIDIDSGKYVEAQRWYGHADLPITRAHSTRSGGWHILFLPDARVRNTASKICRGVDTRGAGGYIIWWPACGFKVLHGATIAAVPEWLIEQLAPKPRLEAPAPYRPQACDEGRIADALRFINADDRDTWLAVGMALHHELGGAGREIWDRWSQSSKKFDAKDQECSWRGFGKKGGVTAATIFHLAYRGGWRPEYAEEDRAIWRAAGLALFQWPPRDAVGIFMEWARKYGVDEGRARRVMGCLIDKELRASDEEATHVRNN